MRAAGSSLATVRSFSATAAAREPALVCSWQTKRPAPEWNRRVPPEFLQSRAREAAETGLAPPKLIFPQPRLMAARDRRAAIGLSEPNEIDVAGGHVRQASVDSSCS